jgi:hypothetical protein
LISAVLVTSYNHYDPPPRDSTSIFGVPERKGVAVDFGKIMMLPNVLYKLP